MKGSADQVEGEKAKYSPIIPHLEMTSSQPQPQPHPIYGFTPKPRYEDNDGFMDVDNTKLGSNIPLRLLGYREICWACAHSKLSAE